MLSGPHRINMIPGGVPYVIHTSQYEYWYELSFYLIDWDGKLRVFQISEDVPGWLIGRRPDGKVCVAELRKSGTIVKTIDGQTRQLLKDPNFLGTRSAQGTDLDYAKGNGFTEIAGDVMCEILINIGHAESYDEQESYYMHTANFIIRVEPSPIKKNDGGDDGGGEETTKTLTGLRVTEVPNKTTYWVGDTLDLAGLQVTADYSDGDTSDVTTKCTLSVANGQALTSVETVEAVASFTEKGVTKTAAFTYEVRAFNPAAAWTSGSDADVAEMLRRHYAGEIDLQNIWSVGDERTVQLPAMEGMRSGESHEAQEVVFVIVNKGGKTLVNPEGGKTECAFIVQQKYSLLSKGIMNLTASKMGWMDSDRRTWLNTVYRDAIPEPLRSAFKMHINAARSASSAELDTAEDYFAFSALEEVIGTNSASQSGEGRQWDYYKTEANRQYKGRDASTSWWMRSAMSSPRNNYYKITWNGTSYGASTGYSVYEAGDIVPFGCL